MSQTPEIIAAVDLGSNSFHMIVCRIQNGQITIIDRLREMVRLAAGIDRKKHLSFEVQERALECLTRFGQRLSDLPAHCVRIVGTNTLRSASNANEFILKAEQCLGHTIEIISGVEEARLIYLGVSHNTVSESQRRLVMDIGGGSTELIIGEQFEPLYLESLYLGCVSMSQRFFKSGKITKQRINKAKIAVKRELGPYVERLHQYQWQCAIGASGTIRAISKIVLEQGWSEHGITLESLDKLMDYLIKAKHIDNLNLEQLDPERAPVFAGGLIILYVTFKCLNIKEMRVSDGALREGLIHDLLGRIHHEDVRSKSIGALATQYHSDLEQVQRVKETTLQCIQHLASDWHLEVEQHSQWLEWASMLYEIGLAVAHSNYHKHGAYIIEHSDIAGFSKQEQQLLAYIVLAHRRKFPAKQLFALPSYWHDLATKLSIIFRLASLLNRSRTTLSEEFNLSANAKSIHLRFPDKWLDTHSLTRADLKQEIKYLEKINYQLVIH